MSHGELRKENNCLNCNAVLHGRYCQVCGQENTVLFESVGQLIIHAFNDFTHFDGKFFRTMKYLIRKPGFLTSEYQLGRRHAYVNPVRLYLFSSAVFFFIFFSVFHLENSVNVDGAKGIVLDSSVTNKMPDSAFHKYATTLYPNVKNMTRDKYLQASKKNMRINYGGENYKTREEYDSLQSITKDKDNWLMRQLTYKSIQVKAKYEGNNSNMVRTLVFNFTHSIPQMLFISLPLLALILHLLYIRKKEFFYVSHAIFTIHLFIFVYALVLLLMTLYKIDESRLNIPGIVFFVCYMSMFYYQYRAMRVFYGQGRGKTLLKQVLFNIGWFFVLVLLFVIFLFISYFKT
ncbi:MAG: DUF3667 domain-containing protein [Ferruginibacter sp.]